VATSGPVLDSAEAAVDGDRESGDVGGDVAGEEDRDGGKFAGVGDAGQWCPGGGASEDLSFVLLQQRGVGEAGADRVDPDALAAVPAATARVSPRTPALAAQ
jgi:hypothetical protein